MKKIIIVSVSNNGVIGLNNKTPWKNSEDMEFFKSKTLGNIVLMGRKTFDSISTPLSYRINLVISNSELDNKPEDGLFFFQAIDAAIKFAETFSDKNLFIIGGSKIYSHTINNADEIILSRIPVSVEGDSYFPKIDKKIWELLEEINYETFKLERYVRSI